MPRSKDKPSKPRGTRARAGAPTVCLTAYVSPTLARAAKVRAAREGRTLSAVISEALERAESGRRGG